MANLKVKIVNEEDVTVEILSIAEESLQNLTDFCNNLGYEVEVYVGLE